MVGPLCDHSLLQPETCEVLPPAISRLQAEISPRDLPVSWGGFAGQPADGVHETELRNFEKLPQFGNSLPGGAWMGVGRRLKRLCGS